MSTKSRLDPRREDILARLARGESVSFIARQLKVPRTTLRSYLETVPPADKPTVAPLPKVEDSGVSELDMVRAELIDARRALSRLRSSDVDAERRHVAIVEALADVRPSYVRPLNPPPKQSKAAHHCQALLLSDFHGGERVSRHAVNGLNEYDWDIMESRVDETLNAVLSHRRNSPDLTHLVVAFVGDMCSGSNHEELARTNIYPLAEQGVKMGYVMGSIVMRLASQYPKIEVVTVPGNHPRLDKKPAAKNVHDNMDWIAGVVAKEYTRALPNVQWTNAQSNAHVFELAGRNIYLFHGDGIRSSMPGVPWGGVMRRMNTVRASYANHPTAPVRLDEFWLGHYHQANAMQSLGIFMNGSLKGTDEWVTKTIGAHTPPGQLLLEYDAKRQRQTAVKFITPTSGL